ncbi:hypothetical protein PI124_g16314 [Phytophthora idaei]|nr:hypothetical protein PI125_g16579 [Phytophthora idaei]KAG3142322.1 hypothetical protein PI126_g15086 [Phytophthora idaei]KAG3238723.1 hypothetical protein PI124_g16314 [Phytophthora idaei]
MIAENELEEDVQFEPEDSDQSNEHNVQISQGDEVIQVEEEPEMDPNPPSPTTEELSMSTVEGESSGEDHAFTCAFCVDKPGSLHAHVSNHALPMFYNVCVTLDALDNFSMVGTKKMAGTMRAIAQAESEGCIVQSTYPVAC